MNDLYVFAIGGSGERVMYSFLMSLISGVSVGAKRVVPVFVDNDEKSKALTNCINLLKYYNSTENDKMGANSMYQRVTQKQSEWPSFFKTVVAEPIILNVSGQNLGTLDNIIGHLDRQNPILNEILEEKELLFSADDSSMPLNVGFVGNPNIGSVVLNTCSLQGEFSNICAQISNTDGAIVIGSLFGGTGAAGIPLIVHRLTDLKERRPTLGGIALLPYFDTNKNRRNDDGIIDTDKYDVDSDSFDTKTRAALKYYDDHMRGLDYLYYVGGEDKVTYDHCVGGKEQNNPIHLVELMAALSIVDFSNKDRQQNIEYRIPIWNFYAKKESNLTCIPNVELKKSIVKFQLMQELFKEEQFISEWIGQTQPFVSNIGFDMNILNSIMKNKNEHSWGFFSIIKLWNEWIYGLEKSTKYPLNTVNTNTKVVDEDSLSKSFYTENEFGIAKTRINRGAFAIFGLGKETKSPAPLELANELRAAYLSLFPNGELGDAGRYPMDQKIPLMLQIISKALDSVISKNCNI